jgi:hypothetical protein
MSNQKIELKLAPSNRRRNKNKGNKKINQNTQNLGVRAMKMMGVKIPPSKQQQSRRRKNANKKMNNGGRIDRFPRGNVQGTNFRSGKISRENDMEYIGEVVSNSTGFSVVNQYACNPGQAATFPWLSKKALLYEKYEFKSLDFIYKPEVTQFASLGTTGKVILSFDYDASDPAPSSKQNAEDTDPSADGMPYEEICLTLKPKEMHKNSDAKFVRPGGLPGGSDIKTYDCGNFFVSISGIEANSGTLGELWVRYNCVLSVPVLESLNVAPTNYFATCFFDNAAVLTTTVGYQPLLAAVGSTTVINVNGIGVVNTAGSIVPPPGNYLLDAQTLFVFTGLASAISLEILKNGNIQNEGVTGAFPAGYITQQSLGQSIYISCNGTDAITLLIKATFTTGSATAYTTFRLVAI